MGRIPGKSETKENEEKGMEKEGKENERGEGGGTNISCIALCTKTNLLALCDESKQVKFSSLFFSCMYQVTMWKLPEAEMLSSRTLERKATRAIFTHDSK